jgi:hypothetical protein
MLPRYTDKCRCSICGEYFNSSGAFGRHRVGPFAPIGKPETRRCLSVEEMLAKDFFKKSSGHWARGKRPANAVAIRQVGRFRRLDK